VPALYRAVADADGVTVHVPEPEYVITSVVVFNVQLAVPVVTMAYEIVPLPFVVAGAGNVVDDDVVIRV
jgi:hypothetical protein